MLSFALFFLFAPSDHPPQPAAETSDAAAFYLPRDEAARNAAAAIVRPGVQFAPGRGLQLSSRDDRFALSLGLRTAFIYSARRSDDGTVHNLDIRRLRVLFAGHLLGRHNKYYVQLALSPHELGMRDGLVHDTPILDAYLKFDRLHNAVVTVGQFRLPFSRERNVSDVNPLLVDRSLANAEFNLDRDVGVGVHTDDLAELGHLRYYAGVFMGEGRDTGRFGDSGLLYVARADLLPFGVFDDYESSDLTRLRRFRASFGAAYAFHDRARKDHGTLGDVFADGGTATAHNATADATFKWRGWSLVAAWHWRPAHVPADRSAPRVNSALRRAADPAHCSPQDHAHQPAHALPRPRV